MKNDDRGLQPLAWLASLLSLLFLAALAPDAEAADGKQLYIDSGCAKCHSVLAEGIEVAAEEEEEEDDPFGGDEGEEEEEPGDLSGLGASWEHDGAKGLEDWLMKKLEVDGKKHKKRFKGSKTDLKDLAAWLMGLTKPAPAE
jgi:mono/diheme cytochrome c family protein